MKKLNEYIIKFKGLKDGEHSFDYKITKSFLANFDNSDIKDLDVFVDVRLIKNNRLLEFNISLVGSVAVECDRCLDDLSIKIKSNTTQIVKCEDVEDSNEDIIYLPINEGEINISQMLYESIIFSIPAKRIHPTKNGKSLCNPQMLEKLNIYLSNADNKKPDMRWNELVKMLNN